MLPSICFVVIGKAIYSSLDAYFTFSAIFLFLSSLALRSLICWPIFICFSIKFFAWTNEPINFSLSSRLRFLTLFWWTTLAILSCFSFAYTSLCLFTSSSRRILSSMFKFRNTDRFLFSSLACSYLMILLISLYLATSFLMVSYLANLSCMASSRYCFFSYL